MLFILTKKNVSSIKKNLIIFCFLQDGDGELVKNLVNGKLDNLRKLEAKKSELEKAEEKILQSAATRKKSGNTPPMGNESPVPPPVPTVPPPDFTPSGAQRLDALIGGSTSTPVAATKTNGISSKKVSFAAGTYVVELAWIFRISIWFHEKKIISTYKWIS